MDHLFHKNILQQKNNLEWQLAEANAKIEKLQRTISSLKEEQTTGGTDSEGNPTNADDAPSQPFQLPDGRWISPVPNPPFPSGAPYIAPWLDDDWMPPWAYPPGTRFPPSTRPPAGPPAPTNRPPRKRPPTTL